MVDNTTSWNLTNDTSGMGYWRSGGSPIRQMTTKEIFQVVGFGVLAAMIVFANSLMIGAFHINRRLRTKTNLLLMSLAVADLLVGTISLPLWMSIPFTINRGPIYKVYLMFDIICGVSSILNMTAVSLERYYALRRPIKHRNSRRGVFIAVILVAWILAILAGTSVEFFRWKFYRPGLVLTVAFFFVPLAIILGTYGTIFYIARAHAHQRGRNSFKKDLRIATTVAVVIGLFVICWTPFFALNFATSVCRNEMWIITGCQGFYSLPIVVFTIGKWLQYGNSVCNPIIYGLRNEEFRRTFRKMLLRLCCKKVLITEYDKNTHGGKRKPQSTAFQCEAGCESLHLRSVTPSSQPVREGYCFQSDHPIKLEILAKKSLADGILKQNKGCAHHSFLSLSTSASNQLTMHSICRCCAFNRELCNPSFEPDLTEPVAGNMTGMPHERYTKASMQKKESHIQLTDSKD